MTAWNYEEVWRFSVGKVSYVMRTHYQLDGDYIEAFELIYDDPKPEQIVFGDWKYWLNNNIADKNFTEAILLLSRYLQRINENWEGSPHYKCIVEYVLDEILSMKTDMYDNMVMEVRRA